MLDVRLFKQNKVGSPPSLTEQLVVRDEDEDEWYIAMRVHAGVEERGSHFITFDTLLFVDVALPGHGQIACCAAVCRASRAPADDDDYGDADSESSTSQLPQQFRHIASVVLVMVSPEDTRFGRHALGRSGWEPPRMGALAKKVVLLI